MSDKLIVEFYSTSDLARPLISIYSHFGGDNPSSAATTLCDFFDELATLKDNRFNDASVLAARFIVWDSANTAGSNPLDFFGVSIWRTEGANPYQTVRVYACEGRPYVHCVDDEYTSARELEEAAMILGQKSVGPPPPN